MPHSDHLICCILDAPRAVAGLCPMLPLASTDFPHSHDALREAIAGGFARHEIAVKSVTVEGGAFPAVERLAVDLSGATVSRELRIGRPGAAFGEEIRVGTLEITAQPLIFEGTPARLHLRGSDVALAGAKGTAGELLLTLQRARDGELQLEVQHIDLERLVRTLIAEAAGKHGVDIKQTKLALTPRGPRSLGLRINVTAKVMFMSAPLALTGDLDLDEALQLRISNLALSGSGMAASLGGQFLRPHFERIQSQPISLAVLSLGEVRLRDVELTAAEAVTLRARFSS